MQGKQAQQALSGLQARQALPARKGKTGLWGRLARWVQLVLKAKPGFKVKTEPQAPRASARRVRQGQPDQEALQAPSDLQAQLDRQAPQARKEILR